MKELEALIDHLHQDDTIKSFKKLEALITNNPHYQTLYQNVIKAQKAMVQAEKLTPSHYEEKKQIYNHHLFTLSNHPVIHQYLTLQTEANEKIQQITNLIETVLNQPFIGK